MTKLASLIIVALLAGVVGGIVLLSTWDPPSPSAKIEKVVPDDRFKR